MNDRGPRADWDDGRLDAAFRARFGVTPPPHLTRRVIGRLALMRRRAWPLGMPAQLASAVAVAIVAIVGMSVLGVRGPSASTTPSTPGPSFRAEPSPTSSAVAVVRGPGWPFPDRVRSPQGEYPVASVQEAIAERNSNAEPIEIAVGGWQADASARRFCELVLADPGSQLQSACANDRWLGAAPQPDVVWSEAPPEQPAIRILAVNWRPGAADIRFEGNSVGAVMVGHFHDPMTAQCRPTNRNLCDATFIVDDVVWTLTPTALRVPPPDTALSAFSVAEALEIRDSGSSLEIAAFGFYVSMPVPCPHPAGQFWPLEDCLFDHTWLMANPEQLDVVASDGSGSIHPPSGPAFNLATFGGPSGSGEPVGSVVVGHFNDPLSDQCPAGPRRVACQQRFVVDGGFKLGAQSTFAPWTP